MIARSMNFSDNIWLYIGAVVILLALVAVFFMLILIKNMTKTATDGKKSEDKTDKVKSVKGKDAENKGAEVKAAEVKAAEVKTTEVKTTEVKTTEVKTTENKNDAGVMFKDKNFSRRSSGDRATKDNEVVKNKADNAVVSDKRTPALVASGDNGCGTSAEAVESNIDRYFEQFEHKLEKMLDEKLKEFAGKLPVPSANLPDARRAVEQQEKPGWSKEKSDLEEKLKKEQEKVADLQKQKADLEKRIHEMKVESSAWREQIAALNETVKGISAAPAASPASPVGVKVDEALKKELARMDHLLSENCAEVVSLNDKVTQNQDNLSKIISQLHENFKGIKAVIQELKNSRGKGDDEVKAPKNPEPDPAVLKELNSAKEELNNAKEELNNLQKELDEYKEDYDKVFGTYSRFRKDVHKVVEAMVNAKDSTSPEYLREVMNECMNTLYDKLK